MKLVATATVLAALAVAASPATAGQPAYAALKGYHYCGQVSNSFTMVDVYGRHVNCKDSRNLYRLWRKKLQHDGCNQANRNCEVTHVHHFRCVFGGDDALLRLRCTRGQKRVRAYWGG